MSGFIPKRVLNARIANTIESNQTPMEAGLAPRIGKSGASIRLYYQRVDECFCLTCPPIKIIKRFFTAGNVGNNTLNAVGLTTTPTLTIGATQAQQYYGIVFDRPIKSPQQIPPAAGNTILLRAHNVDWTTGIDSGGGITECTITDQDFQILTGSGTLGGPAGLGFVIDIGKGVTLTKTTDVNPPPPPPVVHPQWKEINTPSAGPINYGEVELQSSVLPGDMAYIITNPNLISTGNNIPLGGHAMLFNISKLVINSAVHAIISPVPAVPVDFIANTEFVGAGGTYSGELFRINLGIAMGFIAPTVLSQTNNISTTYTPTANLSFTANDCPEPNSDGFNAPIGGFSIPGGTNGQPPLVLFPIHN